MLTAIWALVPAQASAAPSFNASFYPATIHGSATKAAEQFGFGGVPVTCATTGYHAVIEKASTTLSLAPTYSGCQVGEAIPATVTATGCKFVLHIFKQTAEDKYESSFDVVCEAGKAIRVISTNPSCEAEIASQSGLTGVGLANDTEATPKPDITFDPEVSNIAYTVLKAGFLCPFKATGAKTDGTLTASSATTLTGQSPGSPETKIGVEVDEPPPEPPSFNASFYPATIHGSATKAAEQFGFGGVPVTCATTGYHAVIEKASTTLSLAPTYSGCQVGEAIPATVTATGCKFVLHIFKQTAEDKYESSFDVVCEAGKAIRVISTNPSCEAEIASQSGLTGVGLANDTEATPKPDITFDPEVSNIAYTVLKAGFLCPFKATGAKTDGTLTASSATTLTGQSPGSPETKIGVEVDEPPPEPPSFNASFYPATIHGSATKAAEQFGFGGVPVTCATTGYHAVIEKASTTLSLAPTYSGCQVGEAIPATVTATGCKFVLHIFKQTAEDKYESSFDVVCEAGKAIRVISTNPSCEAEIASQSGLTGVGLANDTEATPKPDITFDPEVSNIAYTVLKAGFLCPFKATGAKTDGTLTASSATTLTGQSPGSPETKIGVEVD